MRETGLHPIHREAVSFNVPYADIGIRVIPSQPGKARRGGRGDPRSHRPPNGGPPEYGAHMDQIDVAGLQQQADGAGITVGLVDTGIASTSCQRRPLTTRRPVRSTMWQVRSSGWRMRGRTLAEWNQMLKLWPEEHSHAKVRTLRRGFEGLWRETDDDQISGENQAAVILEVKDAMVILVGKLH